MGNQWGWQRQTGLRALVALIAVSVCLGVTGCTATAPFDASTSTPSATDDLEPVDAAPATATPDAAQVAVQSSQATDGTALAVLASIPIEAPASQSGYTRAQFGAAWMDVDHNGCDTRNDVLERDLTSPVRSGSCIVTSGTLVSAYSGATISFVRGTSTSGKVQIDHMVPLSEAWRTGAQALTLAERESLANDPLNLQAVEGSLNESKGDKDAAAWLPPLASYQCVYVARQVSVKKTYALWVTQAEHDAMVKVLNTCPNQTAYTSTFTPVAK